MVCHSFTTPRGEENCVIGDTAMRLRSSTSRILRALNSLAMGLPVIRAA